MSDYAQVQIYTPPYDFIDNGAAELMLVYETPAGAPASPVFYFDGGSAVLKRGAGQFVVFPFIDSAVRKLLNRGGKITVAEMDGEEIARSYETDILSGRPRDLPSDGRNENIGQKENG